jgi:glycosyltransferase involved in cell wall biosynthesis
LRRTALIETLYDARWVGNHGIGRFASELQKLLPGLVSFQARRPPWHALDPMLLGAALWGAKPRLFFSPGYNSPLGWPGRFVFTLHDLNHLRIADNSSRAKRAYYRYIIKPACHRAECVLTVSEYSRHEIAEWAEVREDKIVNVGNGVGQPFSPHGEKYDPGYPYLLYVGSRKPHKNLSRLLRAYSIAGVHKDVFLLISGEADRQMATEVTRLGLDGHVVFRDLSADQHLAAAYRGAVAFLFPSLYEGFGLPPLEAMACGTPVLTSNVCSLPEVVGDGALLVDPKDDADIAYGIKRLVEDREVCASLSARGLLRAKKFTWAESARKTRRALELAAMSAQALGQHA